MARKGDGKGPARAEIEQSQDPKHRHRKARPYQIRGDFLFHCHVEMHVMAGLVGLVRSQQTIWLICDQADHLKLLTGLPLDPGDNECPPVDPGRCTALDCGKWEEVAGIPQVTMMHATLLPNTQRVLLSHSGRVKTLAFQAIATSMGSLRIEARPDKGR